MPSATHQNFVLLFRRHPKLTFELARRAGAPVADTYEEFEDVPAEFDDPLESGNTVRADVALVGHKGGKPRRGLVLEVQLGEDGSKEWTTVLYRAGLRRQKHCPAWSVVFSPDEKVRDGFRDRMFTEEPELRPKLITPEMITPARDLATAMADYAKAVVALAMHPTGPDAVLCAKVAIQALLRVAPEDYGRYIQLVTASVGEEVMQQVRPQLPKEDLEPLSEWERRGSAFTRGLAEGLEQGREQGREEGLEQGLEQGLERGLEAMRSALRTILQVRGLIADEATHARIAACSEVEELRQLIARASTLGPGDDLFDARV